MIELRRSPAASLSDTYLLARLWPRGLRTAGEAVQLLWLLDGDVRETPAIDLLEMRLRHQAEQATCPHGLISVRRP